MKNRLLLLLSRCFTKKNPPRQRFLVVSTTGLGDSLWATPALHSLRNSFPRAHIALLTTPLGEQVFRKNPWTNEIIVFKEPLFSHIISLWKTLRKQNIDTVLNLHSSQRAMLPLCASIGASRIVGSTGINKGLDSLLTIPLNHTKQHEIVRRLEIVEAIGAKRCSETLSSFSDAISPKTHTIALHPGSKDPFKRWPAEHFIAVGRQLQQMGYQILITGTADEQDLMEKITAQIPGATCSDPHLSLRAFATLLTQVDLLISNDTGPAHLGFALNIPVIALYSPTSPTLCGPHLAPRATALFKRPSCTPCFKRKCRRPFCLLQMSPEDVVLTARKVLMIQ